MRILLVLVVAFALWANVVNASTDNGDLFQAATLGNIQAVMACLAKGADVNAKGEGGRTALMGAAFKGNKEVVQALLAKGADVNAKGGEGGLTALMLAAFKGNKEVVQALLTKGADVNAKGEGGRTALMGAATQGNKEIVQALLAKGADVDAKMNDGTTVLMAALMTGHRKVAQTLLNKGANVNAKNENGLTALTFAVFDGHKAIIQALIDKGADTDAKGIGGGTASTKKIVPVSKLSSVLRYDMIGAEINYLESIIGPAFKRDGLVRTYLVDSCKLGVGGTIDGKINFFRLEVSEDCTFDLQNIVGNFQGPMVNALNFEDFETDYSGGRFYASCLSDCGNSESPVVYEYLQLSHADDYLEVLLEASLTTDDSINASFEWQRPMENKEGREYVVGGKFNCSPKYDKIAHTAFEEVPITAISVGRLNNPMEKLCWK